MIFKIYTNTKIFVEPGHALYGCDSGISICFYNKNLKLLFCKSSKSEKYITKLAEKGFNFTIKGDNSDSAWGMVGVSCDAETILLCALLADQDGIVTVNLK